ncbi:MAG TPA: hypothetical protein VF209_03570 [Patescibacteria group bacterium]
MKTPTFWFYFGIVAILLGALFLRLYKVTHLPQYWEEVALGYDAYAIAKTGRDHHGHSWPIVAFESFGDWKPSLYFYSIVPFIHLLGLNVLAVRLPSILSGVAIVGGVGALAYSVSSPSTIKNKRILALIAMTVTALSPWAVMFSRAGWEVNLASALMLWGVVAGLWSQKRVLLLGISALLLVLSMYTYHAARIVAPLLGIGVVGLYFLNQQPAALFTRLKSVSLSALFALLLLSPLIFSLGSQSVRQRFAETSIFNDLSIIEESNALKESAGSTFWARLLYHRYLLFGREVMINYLEHFRLDFLFLNGDSNPRHSIQYFGHLYHIELLFLLSGVYYLCQRGNKYHVFLMAWLFMGIIPAAITQASPHALRILPTLPVWMIVISYGIFFLASESCAFVRRVIPSNSFYFKYLIPIMIGLIYLAEFTAFWRYYTLVYPTVQAYEWQYGYQQLVHSIEEKKDEYEQVYITREYGRPAMYYWFYTAADPEAVQASDVQAPKDQAEVLAYENIKFIRSVADIDQTPALVASSAEALAQIQKTHQTTVVETITYPTGETVWIIYEVKE